jgi:hypothetical protein
MCRFVDKIIQMRDGKIARVFTNRDEIQAFASAHMMN